MEKISIAFESGDYNFFNTFNAPFAIIAYFKHSGDIFLVSDRCAQYPIYYSCNGDMTLASTNYATFFDCLSTKKVDSKWLSDFFLFNYPIAESTPIQDVCRVPCASVVQIRKTNLLPSIYAYADLYSAQLPEYSDVKMKEYTHEIFQERFPRYYTGVSSNQYFCSITSGFDARLTASFKPHDVDLTLYTYGVAESSDLLEGRRIAQASGFPHIPLAIDESILSRLLDLSYTTVEASGGMLNILRSTLAFVYSELAGHGAEVILTGINGDHFFRGSGTVPHVMSETAIALIKDPFYIPKTHPYFTIFTNDKLALEHFARTTQSLEKRYRWSSLSPVERRMMFYHYEMAPKYYGGEAEFAENYAMLTSPFWDSKIRELSYKNTLGTLAWLSSKYNYPPISKKNSLFTHMLCNHQYFKDIPINGIPPKYYAAGSDYYFAFGKILHRIPAKLKNILGIPDTLDLECWEKWFGKYMLRKFVEDKTQLLVNEYLSPETVQKIFALELSPSSRGTAFHLCGRILNAELMLRKFI